MRIGIIGAGFTGLSAALELQKHGHEVVVFEKEAIPGGLAIGFQGKGWQWSLEKHYHHIFASDKFIQDLAHEIGTDFIFRRPNTSTFIDENFFQLDSPVTLLQFSKLSIYERVRMGITLGYLKYFATWQSLESITAHQWLPKMMGEKGYKMVWEPLFKAKFGGYYPTISLAWFWARIKARTTQLGYPDKGFQNLVNTLSEHVERKGTVIHFHTEVKKIFFKEKRVAVSYIQGQETEQTFDRVIVTLPNFFFHNMAPSLPDQYRKQLLSFKGIGAVNMVLELKKPFLANNIYWLNICEERYPFLAVVEHTNFIDKRHYANHHLVYIGNYLPTKHRYFSLSEDDLLTEYDPFLKKLNPLYKENLINHYLFKAPFAQPVIPVNYSKQIMPFETPIKHVYLANMQQVYPWDRGTNFAVELGHKVADLILSE